MNRLRFDPGGEPNGAGSAGDPLTELLQLGAKQLLAQALKAEVAARIPATELIWT